MLVELIIINIPPKSHLGPILLREASFDLLAWRSLPVLALGNIHLCAKCNSISDSELASYTNTVHRLASSSSEHN